MNNVSKDIFTAIHKGMWLSIEYKNKNDQITKYWISILGINNEYQSLRVRGLHLGKQTIETLSIYVKSIQSSFVLEGTYAAINKELVDDINVSPEKYGWLFTSVPNLKILNYLSDCHRMDATPYKSEFSLVSRLDGEKVINRTLQLDDEQFGQIVANFQSKKTCEYNKNHFNQLALNEISIPYRQGLYVLAYRKLYLDVESHCLRASDNITLCKEFSIDGETYSIRQFLDADDFALLENVDKNIELIKDRITTCGNPYVKGVDDRPFILSIGRDLILDLQREYSPIIDMYAADQTTYPLRAFFGEYVKLPRRKKVLPIALLNNKVNLDQLLAINNAMKYPLTYVQGPPGTGKTNTIINAIITAFFNQKTVLFTSYNNHPIDGVFDVLQSIKYRKEIVPFPMIRLGNNEKVAAALDFMRMQYELVKDFKIYEATLDKNHDEEVRKAEKLTQLLAAYEERLNLRERKEVSERLLQVNKSAEFKKELCEKQMPEIERRLNEIGEIQTEEALELLTKDREQFLKYLYYTSAKYIKRLGEPKNKDLLDIIYLDAEESERVKAFNQYIANEENVKKFLRIYPIVATTCISAHRIGEPSPYFDLTIMDEASQGNLAISLVPIIRGAALMLVGDPQQLNPVILLDETDNLMLRKKYNISVDYDYVANSIYKTYLSCDAVSEEILLSHHYRCHEKIIEFNNRKYYNGKLKIESQSNSATPLFFADIKDNDTTVKNTAQLEAEKIIEYLKNHPKKQVGIITPFTKQRDLIQSMLKAEGFDNIPCGTVHAFQGDEKDVILFSLAITNQTYAKTYEWLKNNKELINVATSRAKNQLILLGSYDNVMRLHRNYDDDDLYELVEYVRTKGTSKVTKKTAMSRALGIKPYSTETEDAFMETLNHAIENIQFSGNKYSVKKEVPISQVFQDNFSYTDLFYTGRFDFVVYEKLPGRTEIPVIAIELDGKEHFDDETVKARDKKKNAICEEHHFKLIRVKNSYARRYIFVKSILNNYFTK